MKSKMIKLLFLTSGLAAYYAGPRSSVLGCASFFLVFFVRKISQSTMMTLLLLLFYFLVKFAIYSDDALWLLCDIRFFWGFVTYVLFFSSERSCCQSSMSEYDNYFRRIFYICVFLLFVEFISSNCLSIQWPNRAHDFLRDIDLGVARAYGFGGNATVTSVILISMACVYCKGYFFDLATLVMATSATGFIVLCVKSLIKSRFIGKIFLFLFIAAVTYFGISLAEHYQYDALTKLTTDYFLLTYQFKVDQILVAIKEIGFIAVFFGQPLNDMMVRTGDFQLLDFFMANGVFGFTLFGLIVSQSINKRNILPVILLVLGTFHYQVIFSYPGQIVFAWMLVGLAKNVDCAIPRAKEII